MTLDLTGIRWLHSGRPGTGTITHTWRFAYDRLPKLAWQTGWNAVLLPFAKPAPAIRDALAAVPWQFLDANRQIYLLPAGPRLNAPGWAFGLAPAAMPNCKDALPGNARRRQCLTTTAPTR